MKNDKEVIVYNKTTFFKNSMKGWTFFEFKNAFEQKLKGHNLEKAFKELGGKTIAPVKEKTPTKSD